MAVREGRLIITFVLPTCHHQMYVRVGGSATILVNGSVNESLDKVVQVVLVGIIIIHTLPNFHLFPQS